MPDLRECEAGSEAFKASPTADWLVSDHRSLHTQKAKSIPLALTFELPLAAAQANLSAQQYAAVSQQYHSVLWGSLTETGY